MGWTQAMCLPNPESLLWGGIGDIESLSLPNPESFLWGGGGMDTEALSA